MKSMRPEDRPKAIVLSVLVLVVFGGVFWRMSSALSGTPQPAPNAPVSENITPASSGTTGGGAPAATGPGVTVGGPASTGPAKSAQIEFPPLPPAQRDQDPFREPTKTAVSNDQSSGSTTGSNPSSTPKKTRGSGGATNRITEGDLNEGGLSGPIRGSGTGAGPALPAVGDVKADEAPSISVTGIVDGGGGHSVAIIRVGTKAYVVAQGDPFGDGYRLVEAHPTTVVVTRSKDRKVERKTLTIEFTASG